MTQSRPSQPSQPDRLRSHQSRPGPEDDVMLATGEAAGERSTHVGRTQDDGSVVVEDAVVSRPGQGGSTEQVAGAPADGTVSSDGGAVTTRRAPSQQSRPGPEDDVMLATGRPRDASTAVGAATSTAKGAVKRTVEKEKAKQERIRRQPGRKAWVPNQHGAWAMLVMPAIVGWVVGGFSWKNLLLVPAWLGAYLTYWAWSQWLRTRSPRRRKLLIPPLVVYTGFTAVLGLITILLAPYLLQWAVVFLPLFLVAGWEVWRGRERSLLSGLSTTAAASLMAAVTYQLAVGGAGGFLGTGAGAEALRGASPNGALTGWPWMWLVTASVVAYFCLSVPYIKLMIRERFNTRLLAWTVAVHAVCAAVAVWLATGGYLGWGHAILWVVLAVRSWWMPRKQWRLVRETHKPLRPGTMGVVEMVLEVVFLLTIATW